MTVVQWRVNKRIPGTGKLSLQQPTVLPPQNQPGEKNPITYWGMMIDKRLERCTKSVITS